MTSTKQSPPIPLQGAGIFDLVDGVPNNFGDTSNHVRMIIGEITYLRERLDKVAEKADKIQDGLQTAKRPDWQVLAAVCGVMIAAAGMLGTLIIGPIKETLSDIKASISLSDARMTLTVTKNDLNEKINSFNAINTDLATRLKSLEDQRRR